MVVSRLFVQVVCVFVDVFVYLWRFTEILCVIVKNLSLFVELLCVIVEVFVSLRRFLCICGRF